ncbi:MAG: glycosyltransferase family 1 protein [Planctomycetota bacterium]
MKGPVVAFDGSVLAAGPPTGVARAFLTTLHAYAAGEVRCVLLLPPDTDVGDEVPSSVTVVPAPRGSVRKQLVWPRLLRRLRADLLHVPVAFAPLRLPCPVVVTVHDLPWRVRPRLPAGDAPRGRHRLALRLVARAAFAHLVPSQATADDLRAELPHLSARVRVVPHGVAPAPAAAARDLQGDLVVLGDDRPRKNRARVRAAHDRARSTAPDLPALRFVGPPDRFVSERDKDALLRRARGLVHLSLHEGFGLPVLEAMVRGVPVLCSTRGGLAELAEGGAALTADPLDVDAMAAAMLRLCHDEDLRAHLRQLGLRRAAVFTPERSAEGWRRVHAEALAAS